MIQQHSRLLEEMQKNDNLNIYKFIQFVGTTLCRCQHNYHCNKQTICKDCQTEQKVDKLHFFLCSGVVSSLTVVVCL